MNRKKLVSLCLVLALLVTAAVGATFAYFTDSEETTNTFTVGNVDITLDEPSWKDMANAIPGHTYAKDPFVKNEGSNPAYIRVDVTVSDADAFLKLAEKYKDNGMTDLTTLFGGHDESLWKLADVVRVTDDDTLTYQYYLRESLASGASTEAIFESVTIPGYFTNADMESLKGGFTIDIKAHAIQADGFNSPAEAFASDVYKEAQPAVDTHKKGTL